MPKSKNAVISKQNCARIMSPFRVVHYFGDVLLVISGSVVVPQIVYLTHTFSLKVMTISDEDGQPAQEVFLLVLLNHPSYSPYQQNGQLEG